MPRLERPPRGARVLLSLILHPADRRFALADLEEEFEQRIVRSGRWSARRWFRGQALRSVLPGLRGRLMRRRRRMTNTNGMKGEMMWGFLHEVRGDLRHASRSLRRAPGVLFITVVSLGVGIGAMTAVFGVANSFLFRGTVGISNPETLVAIYTSQEDGEAYGPVSYPDYLDVLSQINAIDDAAAINMRTVAHGEREQIEPFLAEEVTSNYFAVTGADPVIGRGFLPEEVLAGGEARVALVSHGVWQSDFAGQSDVLGSTLRLNGYLHTVVGVMPDGMLSRRVPLEPDVWVPLGSVGTEVAAARARMQGRANRDFMILARLAEGAASESLDGQLEVLAGRLRAEYRDEWTDDLGNARSFASLGERDSRLRPRARMLVGGIAAFFFGAAGLILLIACSNVTTLFLARASSRSREMAVRISLGASRRRLVAMFLTEGLVPGVGAGLVGLAVASGINRAMNVAVTSIPFGVPIRVSFGIDGRVMAVAVLLALGASLMFGLIPALEGSRPELNRALKGDVGGASRSGGHGLRNALVVVQCAASVVLLVGATLFVRSLRNAAEVDLGLQSDRIAVATKKMDAEGFSPEEGLQYVRDLQQRLVARPDVEVAHASRSMEMTLMSIDPTIAVEVDAPGYVPAGGEPIEFWRNSVTPGYLEMMGVELIRGRTLEAEDIEGAPLVAVVNETFAQLLWPGEDAVGRSFEMSGLAPQGSDQEMTPKRAFQVVGVTRDGKYFDFDDPPTPYFWTSIFQDYAARVVVSARGTTSAEAMIPVLRENIQLASGEVQFTPPTSLTRQFSYQFIHLSVASSVLKWSGAFGLLLAVIGIYGIVSFAVTQRTREMAIRMAIGAEKRQVLGGVVRDGMRPAVLGLGIGAVFAFLLARVLTRVSVLVGVSALDPAAFVGGTALLFAAALIASLIPGRRALGIDPMNTLRQE